MRFQINKLRKIFQVKHKYKLYLNFYLSLAFISVSLQWRHARADLLLCAVSIEKMWHNRATCDFLTGQERRFHRCENDYEIFKKPEAFLRDPHWVRFTSVSLSGGLDPNITLQVLLQIRRCISNQRLTPSRVTAATPFVFPSVS